jgi:hypothetical protein
LARQQFEELVGAEEFMGIDEEATGGLLEDELGVGSEEVAFEGLVRWMKGVGDGFRGVGLLRKILFGLMDPKYVTAICGAFRLDRRPCARGD